MGRAPLTLDARIKLLKKAAVWHLRVHQDRSVEGSAEFLTWIGDESNKAAWDRVAHLWEVLDRHRESPELSALRARAWSRARSASTLARRPVWHYAAGAAALIVAFSAITLFRATDPITYSTGVSQRRTVTLADGSNVTLDSSSSVTIIQLSTRSRRLILNKGRAHFDVAHDPSRPFSVSVGSQVVIATGTAFNIEKLDAKILVTLTRGSVTIHSEGGSGNDRGDDEAFSLTPGEELAISRAGTPTVTQVDVHAANAWEHGLIVLNDEPLGEAVQQLNRYLSTPLRVDPAIAKMRISGVFNVSKLDSFVGAITNYLPVQSRRESGYVLLERRG